VNEVIGVEIVREGEKKKHNPNEEGNGSYQHLLGHFRVRVKLQFLRKYVECGFRVQFSSIE